MWIVDPNRVGADENGVSLRAQCLRVYSGLVARRFEQIFKLRHPRLGVSRVVAGYSGRLEFCNRGAQFGGLGEAAAITLFR